MPLIPVHYPFLEPIFPISGGSKAAVYLLEGLVTKASKVGWNLWAFYLQRYVSFICDQPFDGNPIKAHKEFWAKQQDF